MGVFRGAVALEASAFQMSKAQGRRATILSIRGVAMGRRCIAQCRGGRCALRFVATQWLREIGDAIRHLGWQTGCAKAWAQGLEFESVFKLKASGKEAWCGGMGAVEEREKAPLGQVSQGAGHAAGA